MWPSSSVHCSNRMQSWCQRLFTDQNALNLCCESVSHVSRPTIYSSNRLQNHSSHIRLCPAHLMWSVNPEYIRMIYMSRLILPVLGNYNRTVIGYRLQFLPPDAVRWRSICYAFALSVTLMYCAQTTESIIMRPSPDCSPTILVFSYQIWTR